MMHPSLRLCSAGRARQPLIHFVGKRQWPSTPEAPHAHPAAPPQVRDHFAEFLKKFKTSRNVSSSPAAGAAKSQGSRSDSVQTFSEFWQAPERLWKHDLEEWEVDIVATGGASRY
ncbi:hypothetical protein WOLCODRAFT_163288 [Wolfiporia cocos MD-104 SS10]|uniref:Uncharacterized protein n=1 Tax=Wolfiporia cocos (strain MD-104) TaxID=742152 RepID=A0A2H3JJD6_WOLCO|nr:hypothetical protein WOLCODRAFT_163288 [Wolfiporia cocos MD-104 SS10]